MLMRLAALATMTHYLG